MWPLYCCIDLGGSIFPELLEMPGEVSHGSSGLCVWQEASVYVSIIMFAKKYRGLIGKLMGICMSSRFPNWILDSSTSFSESFCYILADGTRD